MTKVLLTGGSGFIAAHVLEQLLAKSHTVVTTVRSEAKAQQIRDAYKSHADRLQIAIVPDIAQEGAFDEVAKTPGLEAVLHTASPFHYNWSDAQKELIDPALIGTTSILKSIHRSAPGVKRVVVTSSFAAVLSEKGLKDPNTTFTEESWNPDGIDAIHRNKATAYRVSKKLAEKAAWDFVAEKKPNFDLVTVNPPLVFGPVVHHLASLDSINTSNSQIVALLKGQWKEEIPAMGPVPLWIDVRDVARAHLKAIEMPEAGGKRLFTTAGTFNLREITDIVRRKFPEFKDRLPAESVKGGEPTPESEIFKWDSSKTNVCLGIQWIGLEESVSDLAESLKKHGI